MSATPPGSISLPSRPTTSEILGNSALTTDTPSPSPLHRHHLSPSDTPSPGNTWRGPSVPLPKPRRWSNRQSFSNNGKRRTSTVIDDLPGDEDLVVKLPSLVPGIRPAYSTPLPRLPMVVLCIAMLSELLSANLSTPFMLKMVEGFFLAAGREKNSETEAAVGLWTGNLVSVFFITQFFTSLLWSSIADRHGRRAVLVASLIGSAIALVVFGTSTSLPEAICVRLVQGIFGGAIGVFRGSIRDLTDDTNATRAYAVLGFSWGIGGVIGPILGGVFESPAENFPNSFLARIPLFQTHPYILPTLLGSVILIIGAVLSCFLSWDGGVRGGSRIALAVEKDEPLLTSAQRDASPVPSQRTVGPSLRNKRSALLSPGDPEAAASGAGYPTLTSHVAGARRESRASLGTAYGYGGVRSKHPTLAARHALEAARRASNATVRPGEVAEHDDNGAARFAQKVLLANEENTFNINDLWVSAAIAQETSVFDDDDEEEEDQEEEAVEEGTPLTSPAFPPDSSEGRVSARRFTKGRIVSGSGALHGLSGHRLSTSQGGRRFSTSSGAFPTIFANTGLATPPAVAAAYDGTTPNSVTSGPADPFFPPPNRTQHMGSLSAIVESNRSTVNENSPLVSPAIGTTEKPVSSWKALPMLMIIQYGLLALHGTTHDQIFLSFLVSPYKSGGIGLNPAHFSFLIALMCLFQLVYQFYLYPRLGPPLGRFNHIQMFRLGSVLYIPAYLLLPILHSVASPDSEGGIVVMTLLTMITAIRYCGGTLAYTSVMILINAMSPPHVVGLANGLAQSTVSFARFFGPAIGGAVWSASINGNPSGYAIGFVVVAVLCAVQFSTSFFIR